MPDKLEKLTKLLELLKDQTITPAEVERLILLFLEAAKKNNDYFKSLSEDSLKKIEDALVYVQTEHGNLISKIEEENKKVKGVFDKKVKEIDALIEKFNSIEVKDGKDGQDARPEDVVPLVLEKIKFPDPETGEQIVDKINALDTNPVNQIDASHIKNLPTSKQFIGGMNYLAGTGIEINGNIISATGSGTGDVSGPASSTTDHVATFADATGKVIKDSGLTLSGTNTGDITVTDTDTIDHTLTGQALSSAVKLQMSITSDASGIKLSGDASTPGNSKYYGTNGSGTKGFYDLPGGGTGITRSVNVISTPTTAGATASTDYVYLVSGTTTLTLPTAVGNTNRYTVKNVGVNTVTIATTSAQTIDGSASATLPVSNTSLDLISDNSNWKVV